LHRPYHDRVIHTLLRLGLAAWCGRRLPTASGELAAPGLAGPVTVRRDDWGVPHVEAEFPADAWFGLGFCHAQDRGFQLETLVRVGRGTLAELVGPDGLEVDRLSRRVGFRRSGAAQLEVQDADVRATLAAYAAGVNAGFAVGVRRPPHEFALLGGSPSPWEAADVLAVLAFQAFGLASNLDLELARLRVLAADGEAALRAVDPVGATGGGRVSAELLDALAADVAGFRRVAPAGGGSNAWVIAGERTASGKPLLANDPHLPPTAPGIWYLAHLDAPGWAVAGAGLVGTPCVAVGHNGFCCWGMTAALTDNTDLFVEELSGEGRRCRGPGGWEPVEVLGEVIRVKGGPDVTETVLVTPRGPVISPLLPGVTQALSLAAVWLQPLRLRGLLDAPTARSFDQFRRAFAHWPTLPQNVVYADADGTSGYQLVGQLPVRTAGNGLLPQPAGGWAGLVPFDAMPVEVNPPAGFRATANDPPAPTPGAWLGADYCDDSRAAVIRQELAAHTGWTVADCQRLQRDVRSRRWDDLKPVLLGVTPANPDAAEAVELLRDWDGHVTAGSPAATVFELTACGLCGRVAKVLAPAGWETAMGGTGDGPFGYNLFGERRVQHLVATLRADPGRWAGVVEEELGSAVRRLRREFGPGPAWWAWGAVRPLDPRHPLLDKVRFVGDLFSLPKLSLGGDGLTVQQMGLRPLQPLAPPHMAPGLRAAFDTADWGRCRFALLGGQSGNPFSRHFADQLQTWQDGGGIPMPWTPAEVLRAAVATLRLSPG
jgi:penicillin amidase